jgi:hypothetical protein
MSSSSVKNENNKFIYNCVYLVSKMENTRKVIRDGKVAIIYSPGYGRGWYSWSRTRNDELLFDPGLVQLIESNSNYDKIREYCQKHFPDDYCTSNLSIKWIPVGAKFIIQEYDGSESVVLLDDFNWIEA